MKRKLKKQLESFFFKHYLSPCGNHCGLCGNKGILDTRLTAVTAAGKSVGGFYFCICPNGRSMQKQMQHGEKPNLSMMMPGDTKNENK